MTDTRIGENLARLRGDVTQLSLATAMRKRGWKWSQPTVVAIEKGERSLKLAEAADISQILGVDVADLLAMPPGLLLFTALTRAQKADDELWNAALQYSVAIELLASTAGHARQAEGDEFVERALFGWDLNKTPSERIAERADAAEDESSGPR